MEIDIANIISAAGTLLAAYFAYNQYTKNKLTDLKVEYFKKEEERRSYHRSENSAKVFGELWRVLYETKADRVYIVQPHPLGHIAFLSVQFEVKRKGIAGMRENIQSLPMSEVAVFAENLAKNLFMFYSDIDNQVKDKVAKSSGSFTKPPSHFRINGASFLTSAILLINYNYSILFSLNSGRIYCMLTAASCKTL